MPHEAVPDTFAVTLRDLERRFGDFVAVNRISLDVRQGEIFGFLGPNGAGKSTTIRMLCGLLEPTGGQGTVAGFDIRTQREQIKRNIGYMSQKFTLYDDLTVEENIDFFSGIYRVPKEKKAERKAWVIDMAGLQDTAAPGRACCRAAGSSASPWAAPCSTNPRFSSWTNPPPAWIP